MSPIDWLLDSDPALRWQVLRDIADADAGSVTAERARVPVEGIGADILARQAADGAWHKGDGATWGPTLYTAQLLRATGVDPSDARVQAAVARLADGFRWYDELGGKPFFDGETEPCINGGALAAGGYFGRPSGELVRRLVREQLGDGGWNCDAPQKSIRGSFHSTLCVLEGLFEYERAVGATSELTDVRRRGEEYLLARGLFRRLSTGEVADASFLRLSFPPRCYYDVLRALEYFRDAGHAPDERMGEAVRLVEEKRQADGRWLLEGSHEAVLGIALGESIGAPSRWNTLRALRVLRWYRGA